MGKSGAYYHLNSLDRGLRVLEVLAKQGRVSLSQLAEQLGMDRSACHRSLLTMRDQGYVEQGRGSGFYPSLKLFELAMAMVNRMEFRQTVRPYLEKLKQIHRETVNLGMWQAGEVIFLEKCEADHVIRAELSVGGRIPAHCTALGKAILAFRPSSERESILAAAPLKAYTQNSLVGRTELASELNRIRKDGISLDNEEYCEGMKAVAAPILDREGGASLAISVAGPAGRLGREEMLTIGDDLRAVCREIGHLMATT